MISTRHSDQINFADMSNSLPPCNVLTLETHGSGTAILAWHEQSKSLASAGYDGTVHIWMLDSNEQLYLDRTLIFHMSPDLYGCDLQGKLIGQLRWSASGNYVAAAMENVLNVWSIRNGEDESDSCNEWFIANQCEFVTCIAWPKFRGDRCDSKEYLLVGKINGDVSLVAVQRNQHEAQNLVDCSSSHGEYG